MKRFHSLEFKADGMNPLETDEPVSITFGNPNPTSSKTKDGPIYRVSFELPKDEWQMFMDTETKGMVLEAVCEVTHRNTPEFDKAKVGGPISKNAGMLCQEPNFQKFSYEKVGEVSPFGEENAKALVYARCGVKTRKQLDHDPDARIKYEKMKGEYYRWEQSA